MRWALLGPTPGSTCNAETKSSTSPERPLPVSLNYYQNEKNEAYWISYDNLLSKWTQPFFENKAIDSEAIKQFRKNELINAKQLKKIESKSIPTAQIL